MFVIITLCHFYVILYLKKILLNNLMKKKNKNRRKSRLKSRYCIDKIIYLKKKNLFHCYLGPASNCKIVHRHCKMVIWYIP